MVTSTDGWTANRVGWLLEIVKLSTCAASSAGPGLMAVANAGHGLRRDAALLQDRRAGPDREGRGVVDRGDRDVDGRGVDAAVAVGDGVGERVAAVRVQVGCVGQVEVPSPSTATVALGAVRVAR